jgi:hypothetical protein
MAARSAKIPPNRGAAWPTRIDFADALRQLIGDAIGKDVKHERDFGDLLTAMNEYNWQHGLPGTIPDQRTLLNWCEAASVPQWRLLEPVCTYLFRGLAPDYPPRIKLKRLWQAAEDEKNASSLAKRRKDSGGGNKCAHDEMASL